MIPMESNSGTRCEVLLTVIQNLRSALKFFNDGLGTMKYLSPTTNTLYKTASCCMNYVDVLRDIWFSENHKCVAKRQSLSLLGYAIIFVKY
uniref:Uncharacterized protein n=1 Tax=Romanomermis culicivorax TaxID=13658 RepID=A0A915HRC2_ROMCU